MSLSYTLLSHLDDISEAFHIDVSTIKTMYEPNPVIGAGESGLVIATDKPREGQLFHFGLTPHWSKSRRQYLYARIEGDRNLNNDPLYKGAKGIIAHPMWRQAIRTRRCLIPANAFITGGKQPYLVYRKSKRPFAMAGLWDEWVDPQTDEVIRGFSLLTTAAVPLLSLIGVQRSPLILSRAYERNWTNKSLPLHGVTSMLHPFDDGYFNAYPISPHISSAQQKDRSLLKPTGPWVRQEYEYVMTKKLELQGMGETSARRRRIESE